MPTRIRVSSSKNGNGPGQRLTKPAIGLSSSVNQ